jgi:hypothetical protein
MSKDTSTSSAVSLGFLEFLTLIFITLKLTGYIDWSWWWVLSPLWVQVIIFIFAFILVIVFAATKTVKDKPSGLRK